MIILRRFAFDITECIFRKKNSFCFMYRRNFWEKSYMARALRLICMSSLSSVLFQC
jgi:hypothetical protein